MKRTPPKDVRHQLRREVGFGCPVPDCANPYLEWHHFDPPWHEKEHHEPSGMIALCAEHHRKADAGALKVAQLREFKSVALWRAKDIEGRFDWLRHRLVAVVGNVFYEETPVILKFRGEPIIWFERDDRQHLLLNLKMLTTSREERLVLERNDWIAKGTFTDFECPPSGRLIHAQYANGDAVRIEYFELVTIEDVVKRYPAAKDRWPFELPITCVEIHYNVAETSIEFGPKHTKVGGITIGTGFMSHCGTAFDIR